MKQRNPNPRFKRAHRCYQAGFEHIVGVERSEEYLPYARARLRFWHERRGGVEAREVARAVRKTQRCEEESGQRSLW